MAIVYKNGRLVRETGGSGGYTPEEVQAIIDGAVSGSAAGKAKLTPQPKLPALTPEQAKSRAAFEANARKEGEARKVAEANRVKAQTAWGKKDSDGDGIPNSIDKKNDLPVPPKDIPKNGNKNMATNTPMKDYIDKQLRMAGLPDTPANRSKLRTEYIKIKADETKAAEKATAEAAKATAEAAKETAKQTAAENKIIANKAEEDAKTAATAVSNKAAFDAIMKSIGGYETAAGTAKTDAMQRIKDLYDPQETALGTQKTDQLALLEKLLTQSGTDIDASEKDFLARLITPSAYTDVPLINMPQQQNALMAALQSQGADTGQVGAQSAADASMNDFMKQLISRSNTQYGNAQTNYVDALRNAGIGAAKSGRDNLALQRPELTSDINTKFDDLIAALNTNRTNAEGDIMTAFQNALAEAAAKKVDAETNYPQLPTAPTEPETPAPVDNFGRGVETDTAPVYAGGTPKDVFDGSAPYPETGNSGFTGRPEQGGSGFGGFDGVAPKIPLVPISDATDFSNMTEEDKKKLQEFLANVGSFGNFGMGFLTK